MKKITIIAIGGTISYCQKKGSMVSGQQILKENNIAYEAGDIRIVNPVTKASSAMLVKDLFLVAKTICNEIQQGAEGVVITQGTDTIEETAFFLTLMFPNSVPIIVTGAMRHQEQKGADGGANIADAILVAQDERFKGKGAVVLLDQEINSGWFVKKVHTQSLSAFQSYFGPIGYLSEGMVRIVMDVRVPKLCEKFISCMDAEIADVYLLKIAIGEDGRILDNMRSLGYKGLIIEGFGGGHVTSEMAERLGKMVEKGIPVIMASETGNGETLEKTYQGYPGSEVELRKKGVIFSGLLDGKKARLLLILLLMMDKDYDELKNIFEKQIMF